MAKRKQRVEKGVSYIENRSELVALAQRLKVRSDWHEPDEQDVDAEIVGDHLDNAMGADGGASEELRLKGEFVVVIKQGSKPVARVNLASLLAMACDTFLGYEDEERRRG